MVKNNVNKSSTKTKKKTAPKKKSAGKNASPAKMPATEKKTATKAKGTTKDKGTKKTKSISKSNTALKTKAVKKPPVQKTARTTSKKVSVKELLFKKFETFKTESLYRPPSDEKKAQDYTAPPLVSGSDENEIKKIKTLLFKKFDLNASTEKAAEEKAAAEKAAAEKAAAEKTAAEKAAAEKDTVQKEVKASVKKQESKPKVTVTYGSTTDMKESDPMEKTMKYLGAGFAFIVVILVLASISNMDNYYLRSSNGEVEIWKGSFAPLGEALFVRLPEMQPPDVIKRVYSKNEALPMVYNYYVDKADALLKEPGLPDFGRIKAYLNQAKAFASTSQLLSAIKKRINSLDFMNLIYRADVAASKESLSGLEAAMEYLNEAADLDIDETQTLLVEKRLKSIKGLIANHKAQQTGAGK
jgi:hypothetical protein